MWVRGLKHYYRKRCVLQTGSHPMWVRGLKLGRKSTRGNNMYVAPHVGAWIETAKSFRLSHTT